MPNSPSKQCEPFNPGLNRLTSTDEGLYAYNDTPVPLRQSLRMMRSQPPWRYQNFTLLQNDILSGAFNIWVGLCICLHIISCMHVTLQGVPCEDTLFESQQICPTQMSPGIDGDTIHVKSKVDFGQGGVDQRIFGLSVAALPEKQKRDNSP